MLSTFVAALTQESTMAEFAADSTMTELAAGGVVEYAVENAMDHMDVAEWDQCHTGFVMLVHFGHHPGGLERLSAPGTVDRLMIAIGKWLLEVRILVAMWGSRD